LAYAGSESPTRLAKSAELRGSALARRLALGCRGLFGRRERSRLYDWRRVWLSRNRLLVGRLSVWLLGRVLDRVLRLLLDRVLGRVLRRGDRSLRGDRLNRRNRLLLSRRSVGLAGAYSVLEATQGLTDRRPSFGQLSGADDDQNDHEQDD
jgi:hypothetical protein